MGSHRSACCRIEYLRVWTVPAPTVTKPRNANRLAPLVQRPQPGRAQAGGLQFARRRSADRSQPGPQLCAKVFFIHSVMPFDLRIFAKACDGPGAVRLHAAFRATHGLRRFTDIELLPITQQEGLPLTLRERLDRFLDDRHDLRLLEPVRRGGRHAARASSTSKVSRGSSSSSSPVRPRDDQSEVQVERTLVRRKWSRMPFWRMRWKRSGNSSAGRAGVVLRQLEHRVLDDVERRLLVLDGEDALLEGASLHRGEEVGQFFSGGQGAPPAGPGRAPRQARAVAVGPRRRDYSKGAAQPARRAAEAAYPPIRLDQSRPPG